MTKPRVARTVPALSSALPVSLVAQAMIHANRATTLAMTISLDPGRFVAETIVAGIRLARNLCWRSCAVR